MPNEYEIEDKLKGTPKQNGGKIYKSKTSSDNSTSSTFTKQSSKKVSKSSINFKKVTIHSFKHNAREEEKKANTIFEEFTKDNEFDVSSKVALDKYNSLYKNAKEKRLKNGKNKTADKKNTLWEAIVNLKSSHTLKDVQELAKKIEKETGFITIQVAVHKDEGQEKEGKLIRKNHHAHISFFTLAKNDGQQMYRREHMNRTKLINLQDITADHLGMERGVRGSKAKRLDHKTYKAVAKEREEQKEKEQLLKNEISKVRALLQEQQATRPDYAKLEQANKELKEQIHSKTFSLNDLEQTIKEKLVTINYQNKLMDKKNQVIQNYKDTDNKRSLYINGNITKERIKIKDSLFKSSEVIIYRKESVEKFVEDSIKEKEVLSKEITRLEKSIEFIKESTKELESLRAFVRGHFHTLDLEKVRNIIRGSIPKVEKTAERGKNKGIDKER